MKRITRSASARGCLMVSSISLMLLLAGNLSAQVSWTKHGPAVLSPGASGEWDDQLVAPGTVIFQDTVYKMWYSGYDGTHMRVGYATSPDGINWTKHNGPVLDLGPSGSWEGNYTALPFVYFDGSTYRMWYTGDDGSYERTGYATSSDGINWTKYSANPVVPLGASGKWDDFCATSGPVVFDTVFHMIYNGFADGNTSRGGYASSPDGLNWTKSPDPIINLGSWDTPRVQVNSILYDSSKSRYVAYYGGGDIFGWRISYATAAKMSGPWTKFGPKILDATAGAWDSRYVGWPCVLYDSTNKQYKMWYMGGSAMWSGSVGYATASDPLEVPAEYSTIQEAIDAAADSDVVLVSEGTYFENIRFRGKKITVASQFMADGDTSHISKTIIDGSHSTDPDSGSTVYFVSGEDTNSVLCGFTITGGTGTKYYLNSTFAKYWLRAGGGVFCENAGARITNNIITRNRIVSAITHGGAVCAFGSAATFPFLIVDENQIKENYAEATSGGSMEWSGAGGLRLMGVNARVAKNLFERDTAIGYSGACGGGLLFQAYTSGRWPTAYIAQNTFRLNICKSTLEGAVGGGLCTCWTDTVTIRDNLFEGNVATSSTTSGWAQGGGALIDDESISGYGRKTVVNNRFVGNSVSCVHLNYGGAISLYKTLCTLSGNEIVSNSVAGTGTADLGAPGGGGGISSYESSFRLENNIIRDNTSASCGGGVLINRLPQIGTEQIMINNTVYHNRASVQGGGLRTFDANNLVSANNIFWNDSAEAAGNEIFVEGSTLAFRHCDVQGGYPGLDNIDTIPGFVVGDTLFNLTTESPCIGAGADSIQVGNYWVCAPMFDYDGHARPRPLYPPQGPDIGAQEDQTVTDISERHPEPPVSFALAQNYPNPFNPTTTIRYELSANCFVSLKVYDVLGREVKTLVNEVKKMGRYEVQFDASGLASGVYFYRIRAGNFAKTMKLMVVK